MKLSKYINTLEFEGGKLVHNALYDTAVKIYNPQMIGQFEQLQEQRAFEIPDDDKFLSALKENNFIIDDWVNEETTLRYFYDCRSRVINLFMIVTRNCNFRCPYCAQEHGDNVMQDKVYDAALDFLLGMLEYRKFDGISINWFGGEPTLEYGKIVRFMARIREMKKEGGKLNGIPVISHITSNGYLLTKDRLQALIDLGVTYYQITLDGLEKTHDRNRHLADGNGSWERVVANIKDAREVDADFSMMIRTNFTAEILEDIEAYCHFIADIIIGDDRFYLYFEAAKDYGTLTAGDGIEVDTGTGTYRQLMELIDKKGYAKYLGKGSGSCRPFGLACYAANEYEYMFDWDGSIKKCSFNMDIPENLVGSVTGEGKVKIDFNRFAAWTSYQEFAVCKGCSIFPVCYGRKCPAGYRPENRCGFVKSLYHEGLRLAYLL